MAAEPCRTVGQIDSLNLNMSHLQKDRSSQAKRSLREQTEYLQELQGKKKSGRPDSAAKPDEMERILAYSIQKAKEKLQTIDTSIQQKAGGELNSSRCEEHYVSVNTVDSRQISSINPIRNSSQVTEVRRPSGSGWNDQNSPAIASAMKCLQEKISELESKLETSNTEKERLQKENRRTVSNRQTLEAELQNQKRLNQQLTEQKVTLQRQLQLMKKGVEQKDRALERATRELGKERGMKEQASEMNREVHRLLEQCQQKDFKIESLAKEVQQHEAKAKLKQKEQEKKVAELSKLQHELFVKSEEVERLTELLNQRQTGYASENHKIRELEEKLNGYERSDEINKMLVAKLESELEEQKQRRSSQDLTRGVEQAYIEKIKRLETELSRACQVSKTAGQQKLQRISHQYERLREDYDNLLLRYERAEDNYTAETKEAQSDILVRKVCRRKLEESRNLLKEFVDGVQKLPSGVTSHLKYLLTRIAKLDSDTGHRLDRSTSKSIDRLSRSNRIRSASKDSKSGRKRKVLKMEDLNSSRHSSHSIGATRRQNDRSTLKSDTKSVHSRKSSRKDPPLSNSKVKDSLRTQPKQLLITDREIGLTSKINGMEFDILELKKQIKRLTSQQVMSKEQEEERRCRKNELFGQVQLKTEALKELKHELKREKRSQL